MKFHKQIIGTKLQLEQLEFQVVIPEMTMIDKEKEENELTNAQIDQLKNITMKSYFDEIKACDAILIMNYPNANNHNYIGPNTLLEMGIALHHNKHIFLLNPISDDVSDYKVSDEVRGMMCTCIHGDLHHIDW